MHTRRTSHRYYARERQQRTAVRKVARKLSYVSPDFRSRRTLYLRALVNSRGYYSRARNDRVRTSHWIGASTSTGVASRYRLRLRKHGAFSARTLFHGKAVRETHVANCGQRCRDPCIRSVARRASYLTHARRTRFQRKAAFAKKMAPP